MSHQLEIAFVEHSRQRHVKWSQSCFSIYDTEYSTGCACQFVEVFGTQGLEVEMQVVDGARQFVLSGARMM